MVVSWWFQNWNWNQNRNWYIYEPEPNRFAKPVDPVSSESNRELKDRSGTEPEPCQTRPRTGTEPEPDFFSGTGLDTFLEPVCLPELNRTEWNRTLPEIDRNKFVTIIYCGSYGMIYM